MNLIDGVIDTLAAMAATHELILITRGDLLDQENKLERSGLRDRFERVRNGRPKHCCPRAVTGLVRQPESRDMVPERLPTRPA